MSAQLGLELRDESIAHVKRSHLAFCEHVLGLIRAISTGCEFTTDELWKSCEQSVHEPRAMGAAIRDASYLGLIESTGRYQRSVRPACHARPVLVWRRR